MTTLLILCFGLVFGLVRCKDENKPPAAESGKSDTVSNEPPTSRHAKEEKEDLEHLREEVSGYWRGPAGFIEFKPDGTVQMEYRSCRRQENEDGTVEVGFDCLPASISGKVSLDQPYRLEVANEERGVEAFAIVAVGEALYVAPEGPVAYWGEGDDGVVGLGKRKWLQVRKLGCRLTDASGIAPKSTNAVCTWTKHETLRQFVFEVPSLYDPRQRERKTLILMGKYLVPPYLPHYRFERTMVRPATVAPGPGSTY